MKYDLDNLPNGISKESAQHFIDHRKIIKKPLTQHALNIAMDHASNASKIWLTPDQVIDKTIEYGWVAINLTWIHLRCLKEAADTVQTTEERFTDRSWAK